MRNVNVEIIGSVTSLRMCLILLLSSILFAAGAKAQSIEVISVGPSHLDFGEQMSATTSPPQIVVLSNAGSDPLPVNGVTVHGDFVAKHNCPTLLPPGEECTIWVSFKPLTEGIHLGRLAIRDDAGMQKVILEGTGTSTVVGAKK